MQDILRSHFLLRPIMEPTDAVKLIYQSCFGGGHMIRDVESCLAFLRREYENTPQEPGISLLEPIGGGFFRVNLAAMDAAGYTPEALGQDFLRSSSKGCGSMEQFRQRLEQLRQLVREEAAPFSPEALDAYLTGYEAAGFPPVSHSESYRAAWRPAYRVVHESCLPQRLLK